MQKKIDSGDAKKMDRPLANTLHLASLLPSDRWGRCADSSCYQESGCPGVYAIEQANRAQSHFVLRSDLITGAAITSRLTWIGLILRRRQASAGLYPPRSNLSRSPSCDGDPRRSRRHAESGVS
jgi:hypothetical protein